MVVERGLARCPRCVSMADYVFIEHETQGVRYEVRCRKCGERYAEDMRPSAPGTALVLAEPAFWWPPDQEPAPPRDWRAELRGQLAQLSVVTQRGRVGIDDMARRAQLLGEHTKIWAQAHRGGLRLDQTGG